MVYPLTRSLTRISHNGSRRWPLPGIAVVALLLPGAGGLTCFSRRSKRCSRMRVCPPSLSQIGLGTWSMLLAALYVPRAAWTTYPDQFVINWVGRLAFGCTFCCDGSSPFSLVQAGVDSTLN